MQNVGICVEMRPPVTEARYAGHHTVYDVSDQYNKLAADLAYARDYSFAKDASARTMLINDRVAAELAVVVNGENFDEEEAISQMRDILKKRGLPYTTIEVDQTDLLISNHY